MGGNQGKGKAASAPAQSSSSAPAPALTNSGKLRARLEGKTFKVLFVGDAGAGKTSVLLRVCTGAFNEAVEAKIDADFLTLNIKGAQLQLCDTGGQERFRTLTSSSYRGVNLIGFVIDVTNGDSYFNADQIWIRDVQQYAQEDVKTMIIANKIDLQEKRVVDSASIKELGVKNGGIQTIEVSAKAGTNIEALAELMVTVLGTERTL